MSDSHENEEAEGEAEAEVVSYLSEGSVYRRNKQYPADDIRNIEWRAEFAPYDPDRTDMHAPPGATTLISNFCKNIPHQLLFCHAKVNSIFVIYIKHCTTTRNNVRMNLLFFIRITLLLLSSPIDFLLLSFPAIV